jgi:hypothetical protein
MVPLVSDTVPSGAVFVDVERVSPSVNPLCAVAALLVVWTSLFSLPEYGDLCPKKLITSKLSREINIMTASIKMSRGGKIRFLYLCEGFNIFVPS